MTDALYPNFLTDPDEYRQSEQFWRNLWAAIIGDTPASNDWQTPWLGTGSPDIKDGNPIFSAVSPARRRGVRIIQYEPDGDVAEFQMWTDTFGDPSEDSEGVLELVIACVLTNATAERARAAILAWVV